MARLTFLGAAQEVTGSCYLLESPALGRVLLDCGMHQGGDAVKRLQKDNFDFDPASIDAVILSHAHLDHSGLLAKLVHQGFSGPIHCTSATADLLAIMLRDAAGLYERDLERINLVRRRKGRRALHADYSMADVDRLLKLCQRHSYRKPVAIGAGAVLTLHDAGHILGSAIVELGLREEGDTKTLVFSGDLGKRGSMLMKDPDTVTQADVVLMESTYGGREHRDLQATIDELRQILTETWERGGNVLIPSFAVGRAQEILFHLGMLHFDGELDNWQVFLDSPMAIEVTRLYDKWIGLLDVEDIRELAAAQRDSLAGFLPTLRLCTTPEESMAINKVERGAIVIAGSGMCTGGRIRHHLKHRIWRDSTTLLFIGFQARGTLGRLLVDGIERVKMFGQQFAVKARIETLGGFSAHAGQSELIEWAAAFANAPQLMLVHGELESMETLAAALQQQKGIRSQIPGQGEVLEF